jgi:hypothetical protein
MQSYNVLASKLAGIKTLTLEVAPDILCLQEVWQPPAFANLSLPGYQPPNLRLRTHSKGGGIGTYIADSLIAEEVKAISFFEETIFESQAFLIRKGNSKPFHLINIYRPPAGDLDRALELLEQQLIYANDSNKNCFVVGDFNLNWLDNSAQLEKYKSTLSNHGFLMIINEPTRIGNNNSTIIDHILVKSNNVPNLQGVEDFLLSDHKAIWSSLMLSKQARMPSKPTHKYNLNLENIASIRADLGSTDWENLPEDMEEGFNYLQKKIEDLLELHCAAPTASRKSRREPWFNPSLFQARAELKKLSRKAAKQTELTAEYKGKLNSYKKAIRKAKQLYYAKMLSKYRNDSRKTWKLLNEVLGRTHQTEQLNSIQTELGEVSNPEVIANAFNDYFSAIGSALASKIDPGPPIVQYKPAGIEVSEPLTLGNIKDAEILDAFKSLPPKTSASFDNISNKLLKECRSELLIPLRILFNQAVASSRFPNCLKVAKVIYLHKGGDKKELANWRPISLLPGIGKVMEKIINKRVMNHMTLNNLWFKDQYGLDLTTPQRMQF